MPFNATCEIIDGLPAATVWKDVSLMSDVEWRMLCGGDSIERTYSAAAFAAYFSAPAL